MAPESGGCKSYAPTKQGGAQAEKDPIFETISKRIDFLVEASISTNVWCRGAICSHVLIVFQFLVAFWFENWF